MLMKCLTFEASTLQAAFMFVTLKLITSRLPGFEFEDMIVD